jgi:opacity protein-like surface antigen
MGNFKMLALVGALATAAVVQAHAADLAYPLPPPEPVPVVDVGGWYLRGDIGVTNQRVRKLTNPLDASYANVSTVYKNFDSSSLFGIGAGYKFNSWLRADVTGEYRSRANFHGQQLAYPVGGGVVNPDTYTASKSEWLGMVNAYLDLGTWYGITPFVGAGIGFSRNTIHDFTDSSVVFNSVAFGRTRSKTNFAWALHAGLSYQVTPGFAVELAYRYLNMGSGHTGDLIAADGTNNIYNPTKFHNITSNDVKLGVRWMLTDVSESALPPSVPLVRKY